MPKFVHDWDKISMQETSMLWKFRGDFNNQTNDSAMMVGATIKAIRVHGDFDRQNPEAPQRIWKIEFVTDVGSFFCDHFYSCCEEVDLDDTGGVPLEELAGQYVYTAYRTSEGPWGATFIGINAITLTWRGWSHSGYYNEEAYFIYVPFIEARLDGEAVEIKAFNDDKVFHWEPDGKCYVVKADEFQRLDSNQFHRLTEEQIDKTPSIVASILSSRDEYQIGDRPQIPDWEKKYIADELTAWRDTFLLKARKVRPVLNGVLYQDSTGEHFVVSPGRFEPWIYRIFRASEDGEITDFLELWEGESNSAAEAMQRFGYELD